MLKNSNTTSKQKSFWCGHKTSNLTLWKDVDCLVESCDWKVFFTDNPNSADMYIIFRLEPLQIWLLHIIWLPNKYITNMLGGESKKTSIMKTKSRPCRAYEAVKLILLSILLLFLTECQEKFIRIRFWVNLKSSGQHGRLTSLFAKNGLTCMLEKYLTRTR